MTINEKGLTLLKSFESCRLTSYKDSIGVWTIGWGHTNGIRGTLTCTQTEADQWLRDDLKATEHYVDHYVTVDLTMNQFAALCCLVFNIGPGNFKRSDLLASLNRGDYLGAALEFPKLAHAGGVEVPGLLRRRNAEQMLFLDTSA